MTNTLMNHNLKASIFMGQETCFAPQGKRTAWTLRTTFAHKHTRQTHPKYRRSHIQGLRRGGGARDWNCCVASNLIRSHRAWLGSHGFFLGSQLPTLPSCRERVLWSTAGEDAQPIRRLHSGQGTKTANEGSDRRQKQPKARRQSCVVQPLFRTVIQDRIWYFFLMHTVIFM